MRIGMPTLTTYQTIEEQVQLCHELGLELLEINLNYPYCDLEKNDLPKLKAYAKQYHVTYTIHYDEYADFASFHEEIRQAWLSHFKKTVDLAKQIEAARITIHFFDGVHVTLPNQVIYVYDTYYQKYLSLLKDSLHVCFQYALENNIDLCIENVTMPDFMVTTFKDLLADGYHFTYDVGHHYEFGFKADGIYQNHFSSVKHMHLHDVIDNNPHKALGTGILDVDRMMNIAKQNQMDVIIEVKQLPEIKMSIDYLKIKKWL